MSPHPPLLLLLLLSLLSLAHAQGGRPNGAGDILLKPLKPGDTGAPRKEEVCSDEFRTFNGRCTNKKRKEWGSARQPMFSYIKSHSAKKPTGADLPSARLISNVLSSQAADIFNARRLSEMVTFFGQFLDHNIIASSVNERARMPILIPPDDPFFGNSSRTRTLPFSRSVQGPVNEGARVTRPINSLSSVIDLAGVYGSDNVRIKALRTFRNGLLKISAGNLLPLNTRGLRNSPSKLSRYFLAGDHRANEHPVLTSLHTVFLREHNKLCEELRQKFPDWNDELLFQTGRKINGMQFQKIVYEEFIPAMMGKKLKSYKGYKPNVNPSVSDIFSTAAYRVGHTMVGNGVNRRGPRMKPLPKLTMKEMFFRTSNVLKSNGVEPFFRGAIYHRAQEVDTRVHDALRNFLFTNIREEEGLDLIALNLQRGRDHAIPPFNMIRKLVGLAPVKSFKQITNNKNLQSQLATVYSTVDRIEAWIGLMAERHVKGASMGPTMARIWTMEFTRLRDGDRFFYRQRNLIPRPVWEAMPRIRQMLFEKETLRSIILRNTDILPSEIPGTIWRSRE